MTNKGKRIRLSPMQGHALRMLESGGAEPLLLVVNILWSLYSDIDRTVFLHDVEDALRGLVRLGYLTLERYGEVGAIPADEANQWLRISEGLCWREQSENWLWVDETRIGDLRPMELVLSEAGKRALRQ